MDPKQMIEAIAAQKLGPAPADPAAAAAAGAQQPQAAPKADPSPTQMEKAQSKLAPKDAASLSAEESVQYIKVGDRELTPDQILGTMNRYKDLNYRWQSEVAPLKPVMELAKGLLDQAKKAGHDAKPEELAQFLQAAIQAQVKNPQMGNTKGQEASKTGTEDDDDSVFEQWEKENAVKLPPGFKETRQTTKQMQQQLAQMMGMMQQLIQGAPQGQQAQQVAGQQMQQGQQMQADASVMMVRNNLDRAFASNQLEPTPEARADFRMFAAQRGYDFPDFIDPQMAATVVADYKANKNAPEIERLRQIHQRRQAFTGGDQSSPGAGGMPAAPQGNPMLNQMISAAMGKKGLA